MNAARPVEASVPCSEVTIRHLLSAFVSSFRELCCEQSAILQIQYTISGVSINCYVMKCWSGLQPVDFVASSLGS